MNLNKAMLIGRVTRDPELRNLPSGSSVVSFSLATNRTWKNKEGTKEEQVDFHNVVGFGKQAEVIQQYVKKGDLIFIEGRMQTRSWDKDGAKMYRTEVVLDRFEFGPQKRSPAPGENEDAGNEIDADTGERTRPAPKFAPKAEVASDAIVYPDEDLGDIPF